MSFFSFLFNENVIDILSNSMLLEELKFFLPKIILAVFCGGLIGIERGIKKSVAGLRTNILICVGTTIFTSLATYASYKMRIDALSLDQGLGAYGDPIRLWGQIITGVGFIGAGVIFKREGDVPRGITTAAYIWFNCAIGMMIGAGASLLAFVITLGMFVTMIFIELLEGYIFYGAKKVIPKKIQEDVYNKINGRSTDN